MKQINFLILLFLSFSTIGQYQNKKTDHELLRVTAAIKNKRLNGRFMPKEKRDNIIYQNRFAIKTNSESAYTIICILEYTGSKNDLNKYKIKTRSRIGNFYTAEVPVDIIDSFMDDNNLLRLEIARPVKLKMDVARETAKVNLAHANYPERGNGIIIGFFDTGIDVEHPAFFDENNKTRIISIWDQKESGTGPGIHDWGYGVEWTADDINNELCEHTDPKGHGTYVASIAAGNGDDSDGETSYVGVAPESDIIMVASSLTYDDFNYGYHSLTSDVIDGIDYISRVAISKNQPWVVNLSIGIDGGPRNGSSLFEKTISEVINDPSKGQGRVIVVAAGNDGYSDSNINSTDPTKKIHAEDNGPSYKEFIIDPTVPSEYNGVYIEIYSSTSDDYSVSLIPPGNGTTVYGPVTPGTSNYYLGHGLVSVDNFLRGEDTKYQGSDRIIKIGIIDYDSETPQEVASGVWRLEMSSGTGDWDAYIYPINGATKGYFTELSYSNSKLINEPGNALNTITVGSINSKNSWDNLIGAQGSIMAGFDIGEISYFSSPGPTRSGINKPDIYAPGAWIAAALSQHNDEDIIEYGGSHFSDESYDYFHTFGTSFASPFVAGVAALILDYQVRGPNTVKGFIVNNAGANNSLDANAAMAAAYGSGPILGFEDKVVIDHTPLCGRIPCTDPDLIKLQSGNLVGYFFAEFVDEFPTGDTGDSYTWTLDLAHSGGYYTVAQETTGSGNISNFHVSVDASTLPDYSWMRAENGNISAKVLVECEDSGGYSHSDEWEVEVQYYPNPPVLYGIQTDGISEATLRFISGGATSYKVYYGTTSGNYNGTGLNEGNSPISIGNVSSYTLTGLQLGGSTDYYFAVEGLNSYGNSTLSNELSLGEEPNYLDEDYEVDWTQKINTAVQFDSLYKTSTTSWWDAGAGSYNVLPPYEDGWVEMEIKSDDKYRMLGLSSVDESSSWNSIEYNLYLRPGGYIYIYESGTLKCSNCGNYTIGDIVGIRRSGSSILYTKNGSTIYTSSNTDESTCLVVDVSMYTPSAFFSEVSVSFDDTYNITWTDLSNTYISGNDLIKSGTSTWWNGGAASEEVIPSGADGWIQLVAGETSSYKMFGLSHQNLDNSWNSIENNLYLKKGTIQIYESGTQKCSSCGTYTDTDIMRVEKIGSQIYYKKNGATIYTSAVDPNESLKADISIYTPGASLKDVVVNTSDPTISIPEGMDFDFIGLLSEDFVDEPNLSDSTLTFESLTPEANEAYYSNDYILEDSTAVSSNAFVLYPVPSDGNLIIRNEGTLNQINSAKITITNENTAETVLKDRYEIIQHSSSEIEIDISNLADGNYILRLTKGNDVLATMRFIKI